MSNHELEVNFENLKADQKTWRVAADELGRTRDGLLNADLPDDAFSAMGYTLAQAYRAILQHLSENCDIGIQQYSGLAEAMGSAGTQYQEAEAFAQAQFEKLASTINGDDG